MGARIEKNTVELGLKREVIKMDKNMPRILRAGANSLIPLLRKNTPLGYKKRHARDNIAVSNVRTNRMSGEKYLVIGYKKGVSHRIHATEFGTMYQSPQLFVTKTEKQGRNKVVKAMETAARRAIK